ncbi:hypothetical protein [Alkanindiges illinoisensis]|uniref:hypothetical protein n=1 Tax=Alkanindiges illinoisensis TaxID=197183 RepID=UPI000683E958|nr:hypothetical protein [Alkanindiges illinoisensis]
MKKFYILPLACAIAALTACSPAPVKQEIIIPQTPQPAPQPLVLRKVEPETSAPHYHLNPRNYEQPLNPIIVQQIREALTPKIINPATGEVVTRLPLIVPVDATAQTTAVAATVNTDGSLNATDANQAMQAQASAANTPATPVTSNSTAANSVPATLATDSNGIPVAEPQDTQAALLKIDPALKLDDQAVASLAASQAQMNNTQATSPQSVPAASPDNTQTGTNGASVDSSATATQPSAATINATTDTQAASATATPDSATTTPIGTSPVAASNAAIGNITTSNTAKILIPIHQQQMIKTPSMPAPSDETLDVTEIDKDITLLEGKARHYPTYFKDKYERWKAEKKIKQITQRLDQIAVDPRASYDLLLRAMKAHVLARNMDAGPDSAFKSAVYFQRLLKLKPADPETSFWYGFSLGEGGGFRESISHLDTAVKAEYQEAYLALAHSYLQMDDKKNALTVLNNYKIKYPDEATETDQLIAEIQAGKRYSMWQ